MNTLSLVGCKFHPDNKSNTWPVTALLSFKDTATQLLTLFCKISRTDVAFPSYDRDSDCGLAEFSHREGQSVAHSALHTLALLFCPQFRAL
jgi:hypothetical protein